MLIVYVAGPLRAANQWEQEQNVRRAEEIALEIWRLGHVAICPHTNTRFFQGVAPDHVWLEGYLELVKRCDCVVLVTGWEKSEGTKQEIEMAKKNRMMIFNGIDSFSQFLDGSLPLSRIAEAILQ